METTLRDIGKYKDKIINAITLSDDILRALLGNEYTEEQSDDIVYSQVFPYLYVDETQTKQLSYICVEVDVPTIPTRTMKDAKLIVWVYCHKKIMNYTHKGYKGTRTDIIADMFDRAMKEYLSTEINNGTNTVGIGLPTLTSVSYIMPKAEYYGRQLIYKIPDFKVKGV